MSKVIAIDAGHGINTPGRRCLSSLDPEEHREWWLNSRVAAYVQAELKNYDCRTLRTDDVTGAADVALSTRCEKANKAGADAFISIHHNAGIGGRAGGGTVVYAAKNATASKKAWQKDMRDRVVAYNGLAGNRSNPVPLNNYKVLTGTNMPALLIECGFMDSKTDTPIILREDFARKTAKGIAESIAVYLGLKKISSNTSNETIDKNEVNGHIKIIYTGDDGVEVHNTPDLSVGSRNNKYGPVKYGEVFTVVEKTKAPDGTPMYKLKSGLYITASEKYVKFY